jgi:hypothetical protein
MRKMKKLIAALMLVTTAAAAQVSPYVYKLTLSTASVQILPQNAARKRLVFMNPNATAKVAFCPSGPTRSLPSVPVTAAVNAAGCMTLLPYGTYTVEGAFEPGPVLSMASPWLAAADTAGAALTVWEFE